METDGVSVSSMGAVDVDMGSLTPFRDGMEDDVGVNDPCKDHTYQQKPQKRANDARDASRSAKEITEEKIPHMLTLLLF
jgi:hypothetical protein